MLKLISFAFSSVCFGWVWMLCCLLLSSHNIDLERIKKYRIFDLILIQSICTKFMLRMLNVTEMKVLVWYFNFLQRIYLLTLCQQVAVDVLILSLLSTCLPLVVARVVLLTLSLSLCSPLTFNEQKICVRFDAVNNFIALHSSRRRRGNGNKLPAPHYYLSIFRSVGSTNSGERELRSVAVNESIKCVSPSENVNSCDFCIASCSQSSPWTQNWNAMEVQNGITSQNFEFVNCEADCSLLLLLLCVRRNRLVQR